jgi:hypothetical protein
MNGPANRGTIGSNLRQQRDSESNQVGVRTLRDETQSQPSEVRIDFAKALRVEGVRRRLTIQEGWCKEMDLEKVESSEGEESKEDSKGAEVKSPYTDTERDNGPPCVSASGDTRESAPSFESMLHRGLRSLSR